MTTPRQYFEPADELRARLIERVAAVEVRLTGSARAAEPELLTSWAALVKLLALTPPAHTRTCPSCGAVGMRAALRCGGCWNPLAALPEEVAAPLVAAGGVSDY